MWLVSPLSESSVCHVFGVAVLLTKRRPYVSSQSTGFSLLVMEKITTQYLVNQRIVVGELVASYFY